MGGPGPGGTGPRGRGAQRGRGVERAGAELTASPPTDARHRTRGKESGGEYGVFVTFVVNRT